MARKSRATLKRIDAICRGTLQARDWINQPANEKTPDQLARRMAQAARRHGVNATILNEKKLQGLKMGAILAVGAGSAHPPRLLILDYRPSKARGTIALVGKGVTFDAGGLKSLEAPLSPCWNASAWTPTPPFCSSPSHTTSSLPADTSIFSVVT